MLSALTVFLYESESVSDSVILQLFATPWSVHGIL